ncbi:MAG: 5-oxoprolinase subunit PxpA [Saprospiraceae bacterium]
MDINADLGEWYGRRNLEVERSIMPFLTSCNVACGFHSGDAYTIEQTIKIALQHKVKIGAHPSFPDREGFGRRMMKVSKAELKAILRYQIGAIKGMIESLGGVLHHVKAHGALYNWAMKDEETALTLVEVVKSIDEKLIIYGLPHSEVEKASKALEMTFWSEAFADRAYESALTLRSRTLEGAVLTDLNEIKQQVLFFKNGKIKTFNGELKKLEAQTVCIHSDTPKAVEVARLVSEIL